MYASFPAPPARVSLSSLPSSLQIYRRVVGQTIKVLDSVKRGLKLTFDCPDAIDQDPQIIGGPAYIVYSVDLDIACRQLNRDPDSMVPPWQPDMLSRPWPAR